ncbi:GIY-YIG nuclease family protein [Brevundimonas sp. R86498]|uniref:GIY-YIG nuclease family protein n=1 Tax=Brevundimonas sp. R86498 TaxID=3093845 RepID=UPI0037C9A4AD
MAFYAYIVTNQRNGTLYTGSTDGLILRTTQHREKTFKGFTAKYGCAMLVWYEQHPMRHDAFVRERRIKKWNRVWKLELIEKMNPGWRDLFEDLF